MSTGLASTAVSREAWATLPESSSRPLPATLAQSRNLAHASLETAVLHSAYLLISVTVVVLISGLTGRLGDLHVLRDIGVLR